MRLEVEVLVQRGDIAESRHRVQCAAVDTRGRLAAETSHTGRATSFRSAAKPFQLLPFVERGHADALGCSDAELAIMAASHSGSREHLALVRGLLERIGLDASHLACGYHDPQDPESLEDLRRDPGLAGPLYNNCSGKHAGMLALARAEGWPVAGYERPEHPLQQLMRNTVAECCGVRPESVTLGVDGCSVPVFGLPLARMAHGYAKLCDAAIRGGDTRGRALQRIARAMTAHPVLVEGHGRLATDLMLATRGREPAGPVPTGPVLAGPVLAGPLLAKSGAEGLLVVADLEQGLGMAIKCEDGAMRALGPAAVEVLSALGTLRPAEAEALAPHRRPSLLNAAGLEVGWLAAQVHVEVVRDVPA